jgi:aminoglycoside phosphotransferase (APT) family kinase protein
MSRLAGDAAELGWEEARARFTSEVLGGELRAPRASRLERVRAKLTGTTWEDTLQDLVDPTRAGWKFLLDLRPESWVLFLGPSWGAAPLALARSSAHVIVLDGSSERLQIVREQAWDAGLRNLTLARVMDPVRLPLPDGSVDLVVVPGIADWFRAIAGTRMLPANCGAQLLVELRRVLGARGQAYIAGDNRHGVSWLFGPRHPAGAGYSARALRVAAGAAGFPGCELYAPVPFRHKFHQIVDVERTGRLDLCADPYRTRGRLVRPLVKVWDLCNRDGALERRLYACLPGLSAVLSTERSVHSLAERLLRHLGAEGRIPIPLRLSRYYVRPKGVAVLVAATRDDAGLILRLPLDERAAATCALHHDAIETLAADARIPPALRALFPQPYDCGEFEGQTYFAESALAGESGRVYYSRSERRYDRAIANAATALCGLRRATEEPVRIDSAEFDRLCGGWLAELRAVVRDESRPGIDAIESHLDRTLRGAVLPLGWHHGDYDFANLLYGPDDDVSAVLDFEVFEPRGLPLIDLMVLLARRPIRQKGHAFGTLFARSILTRTLPPLEAGLLEREVALLGFDADLYRALALCCWLNHLRLRRDSWLVRSPSWLDANLHEVLDHVRRML